MFGRNRNNFGQNNNYGYGQRNNFNGGYQGRNGFGFGRNRNGYGGNYGRSSQGGTFLAGFAVTLLIIGGIVFAQKNNYLGSLKNHFLASPEQQRAVMNKGIGQATQANKNIANEERAKAGDSEAMNNVVNDKILTKGQFSYLSDAFNFPEKTYAIFVFSNIDNIDKPWKTAIKNARKQSQTTVYTTNGNEIGSDDDTFFYYYFKHNYEVSSSNKNYEKIDGDPHPFMVIIRDQKPIKLVTKSSQAKDTLEIVHKYEVADEKQQNNYKLPDAGVGLKYPDYGKYAKYIHKKATDTYNNIKNNNQ